MTRARRQAGLTVAAVAAAAIMAVPSQAYYHYIHYLNRTAPFAPVYERFDLARLPNNTVTFFVSDQGPTVFGKNDTFGSVLSQIKQALAAWNSVASSDLRVAFGGLEGSSPAPGAPDSPLSTSSTPGGDIIFMDLPGLIGMGGTMTSATPVVGANGPFFPITRGLVMLSRDTTQGPGPSYLEKFFTTAVHEIGHALGLQHTWTAGAMSQAVVRNTSRARALEADDVAALSVLYGKANWQSSFGSIAGRVTLTNNQPVSLASVVAIAPNGSAVSTLTHPDGTYRIDGIPAGFYLVYAHPLPPDTITAEGEGLRLPVDSNRDPFTAGGLFQTSFFPGTLDPQQATMLTIGPGTVLADTNFRVQSRTSVPVYDVVTYSKVDPETRRYVWNGSVDVTPSYIHTGQSWASVIAQPPVPMPKPQFVSLLGGFSNAKQIDQFSFFLQAGAPQALGMYFDVPVGAGAGPKHMVMNFGADIYVLPNAVNVVQAGPPSIRSLAANPDRTLTISGAGFSRDSRVFFDGAQAVQLVNSGDETEGSITVIPPPGEGGQVATVAVYNGDGQNSMLLQWQDPVTYTYPVNAAARIASVVPNALPAGSSALIDINGINTQFVDGQVTVGFGTGDVAVRRVWVLSPTRLIANVSLPANGAQGFSEVSVISGLQVVAQQNAFSIQTMRPGSPALALPVVNAIPTQRTIYPGAIASLYGQNLNGPNVQITLNDLPVPLQFAGATQINFFVPPSFLPGPATLRLSTGQASAFPVMVQIDYAPPTITALTNVSGVSLAGLTVAAPDMINVQVSGLDPVAAANPGRVRVTASGTELPIQQITALGNGLYQIQVVLNESFSGSVVSLAVWVDGSSSAAVGITVR